MRWSWNLITCLLWLKLSIMFRSTVRIKVRSYKLWGKLLRIIIEIGIFCCFWSKLCLGERICSLLDLELISRDLFSVLLRLMIVVGIQMSWFLRLKLSGTGQRNLSKNRIPRKELTIRKTRWLSSFAWVRSTFRKAATSKVNNILWKFSWSYKRIVKKLSSPG